MLDFVIFSRHDILPYFQMGIADVILDLVSSGTTLRENNLKEIEGGVVLQSQVMSLLKS